MGSGASFDNGLESDNSTRFFCHACRRVFGLGGVISAQDLYCPHCHSTFLEEISTLAGDTALRARAHVDLTEEQSRRLANAATMLRLLESQLRDELEQLQLAYANNTRRNEEEKIRPLTTVMKEKLRRTELSLDMLCSQPNCPICSEDFNIGTKALQLPCSHLFHDHCVMPWLEAKRTCPICRFELTDSVPSMEDLLKFSEVELREKLRGLFVYIQDPLNKSKGELAELLHKELVSQKEAADFSAQEEAAALARSQQAEQDRIGSIFGLQANGSTDSLVGGLGLGSLGLALGAAFQDAAAAAAVSSPSANSDADGVGDGELLAGESMLRRQRMERERELERQRAEHNSRWMRLRGDGANSNDNESSSPEGAAVIRSENLPESEREWYRNAGDELDRLMASVSLSAGGIDGDRVSGPSSQLRSRGDPSTTYMIRGGGGDADTNDMSATNISNLLASYFNPTSGNTSDRNDAGPGAGQRRASGAAGTMTTSGNSGTGAYPYYNATPMSMSQQGRRVSQTQRAEMNVGMRAVAGMDDLD